MMNNKQIRKRFNLPETERIVSHHSCAMRKKLLFQGRLYFTMNYLCFTSKIARYKFVLPIHDLTSVSKKTSFFLANSLQICTVMQPKGYYFTSFVSRDKAYNNLHLLWQLSSTKTKSNRPNEEETINSYQTTIFSSCEESESDYIKNKEFEDKNLLKLLFEKSDKCTLKKIQCNGEDQNKGNLKGKMNKNEQSKIPVNEKGQEKHKENKNDKSKKEKKEKEIENTSIYKKENEKNAKKNKRINKFHFGKGAENGLFVSTIRQSNSKKNETIDDFLIDKVNKREIENENGNERQKKSKNSKRNKITMDFEKVLMKKKNNQDIRTDNEHKNKDIKVNGYFKVYNKKLEEWVNQFFELKNDQLANYLDETKSNYLGVIELKNCIIEKTFGNNKKSKGYIFRVKILTNEEIEFEAKNQNEAKKWFSEIQKLSQFTNSKEETVSKKQLSHKKKNIYSFISKRSSRKTLTGIRTKEDNFGGRININKIEPTIYQKKFSKKRSVKKKNSFGVKEGNENTIYRKGNKKSENKIKKENQKRKENQKEKKKKDRDEGEDVVKKERGDQKNGKYFILPESCSKEAQPTKLQNLQEVLNVVFNATLLTCFQLFYFDRRFLDVYYEKNNCDDVRVDDWEIGELGTYQRKIYSTTEIKGAGPLTNGEKAPLTEFQTLFWYDHKHFIIEDKYVLKDAPFSDSFVNYVFFEFKQNEEGKTNAIVRFKVEFTKTFLLKKVVRDKAITNQKAAMIIWEKLGNEGLTKFIDKNYDLKYKKHKNELVSLSKPRYDLNNKNIANTGDKNNNQKNRTKKIIKKAIIQMYKPPDYNKIHRTIKITFWLFLALLVILGINQFFYLQHLKREKMEIRFLKNQTQFINQKLQFLINAPIQIKTKNSGLIGLEVWENNFNSIHDINLWLNVFNDFDVFIYNNENQLKRWNNQLKISENNLQKIMKDFDSFYSRLKIINVQSEINKITEKNKFLETYKG
ncbi:hypothetical protein M0812_13346 [Anaeramoeba flamelloides]|uniref:VASt domain-containing protein n=1 Tax=Anaeramoeba flamelloides TaxID=1746091 RepID=A0AAV7ZKY2_9EUKA|nr:hypothetical protein M0812_13346 [Anaeramoeba flamelloides]